MSVVALPLFAIEVPRDRARDLASEWVEGLAALIAAQGLQHPIRVRHVGTPGKDDTYRLVSGLHRLEAARLLGWTEIPVTVSTTRNDNEARLEEVMENLGRHELIALDRCHHLFELKKVWEQLYPETAHGKASPKTQSLRLSSSTPEIFGFARANAERLGLSRRTIEQAVRVWRGLSAPSRSRLPGTPLADKLTELKALSELKPKVQERVLDLILGDEHREVGNVAQALEFIENGRLPGPEGRRFLAIHRTISTIEEDLLDEVIVANRDRIMASVARLGWI